MNRALFIFGMDFLGLIILVLLGILLIFLVKTFIALLPASIVAFAVWFITGDKILTSVAFLVIAAVSLAKRK